MGSDEPVLSVVLIDGAHERNAHVVGAHPHSLLVAFSEDAPVDGTHFTGVRFNDSDITLGACDFYHHPNHPRRRAGDPPVPPGDGQLAFTDEVYDFETLLKKGFVGVLEQRVRQLPLMYGRKQGVTPAFKDFTADLVFDLQVYRSLLDDIDRSLDNEPVGVAETVRATAVRAQWPAFVELFDSRLRELEAQVKNFDGETYERHGYYFRKHVWDLILSSGFMARTNLRPRGYAGDSEMMRMIYENDFRGPTIFSRFIHRHPIASDAAQAVRNRIELLGGLIAEAKQRRPGVRLMSVACGPARELRYALKSPQDFEGVSLTLLDQDNDALKEAGTELAALGQRLGVVPQVRFIRESVRTMLRTPNLPALWGEFDFLYSMGLFDYLTPPVATAVLARLYQLLAPGGEMLIGNFHTGNPTRVYMEYWMDWVLYYRSEEDFLALAASLPGAEASVIFEATRSQMFLRVRKAAA